MSTVTAKLGVLLAMFEKHAGCGVEMNAEGTSWMIGELRQMIKQAQADERELDVARWNGFGATPQALTIAQQEAAKPGSNILLLQRRLKGNGPTGGPSGGRAA